jgi:hypothetical protein
MEIFARQYETLRVSYDGSQSLRRGKRRCRIPSYDETKKLPERQPREAKFIHFFNVNIKFGLSLKRKHPQVRVKYW